MNPRSTLANLKQCPFQRTITISPYQHPEMCSAYPLYSCDISLRLPHDISPSHTVESQQGRKWPIAFPDRSQSPMLLRRPTGFAAHTYAGQLGQEQGARFEEIKGHIMKSHMYIYIYIAYIYIIFILYIYIFIYVASKQN